MHKHKYFIAILFSCITASAQTDWLAFKKNNRTVQSWSSGSYIIVQMASKQWLEGFVRKVWRDSIRIELVKINRVVNNWGFYSFDTARAGFIDLHVKELRALPKKNFSYNVFSNGQLFKLGALGYVSLNVINSLSRKDPVFAPDNVANLGVAGLVFVGGVLLGSFQRTYWEVGKRYRFVIVPLVPPDTDTTTAIKK
ncbi:MAG: hypothetical protein ACKO1T_02705 [Sediminibacterium sp.]